jgi:predicted phosphodiesterase
MNGFQMNIFKILILSALSLCFGLFGDSPTVLYLTWQGDPSSTMTIQWHSPKKDQGSVIAYQKKGEDSWNTIEGSHQKLTGYSVLVHTAELEGLEADTEYSFQVGERPTVYTFKTMPRTLSRDVRFVVGGDVFLNTSRFEKMNEEIAKLDPDFVVLGGDIAYTKGRAILRGKNWETSRWHDFLSEWKKIMVGKDGRLIPLIVVPGNHDLREKNDIFYEIFAMKENITYRALDFGFLSLFLLDTGHGFPVEGEQTEWLKEALEKRKSVPFKMAAYHIAAYPSVYSYKTATSTLIRQNWCPLFEEHGVKVAFEHHNHAYKRTFPIKAEKIDPEGVVYLGDGSWGVKPRKVNPFWYLASSSAKNCIWVVTLSEDGALIESIDKKGSLIESLTLF